jgi:hypothetical protein
MLKMSSDFKLKLHYFWKSVQKNAAKELKKLCVCVCVCAHACAHAHAQNKRVKSEIMECEYGQKELW